MQTHAKKAGERSSRPKSQDKSFSGACWEKAELFELLMSPRSEHTTLIKFTDDRKGGGR